MGKVGAFNPKQQPRQPQSSTAVHLIDPPGPWAPTERWQDFLAQMQALPPSEETHAAINQAKKEPAKRAKSPSIGEQQLQSSAAAAIKEVGEEHTIYVEEEHTVYLAKQMLAMRGGDSRLREDLKPFQLATPGKSRGSLINPPSPFAPIEELEAFLNKAKGWDQSDPAVQLAVRQAEKGVTYYRNRRNGLA